jgi:hypothetical protein
MINRLVLCLYYYSLVSVCGGESEGTCKRKGRSMLEGSSIWVIGGIAEGRRKGGREVGRRRGWEVGGRR